MLWSRAVLVAVVLALGPMGCGFQPLYSQRGAEGGREVVPELAAIRITRIIDRNGQMLRNDLLERLTPKGEPSKPLYTLTVTLSEGMTGLGQQKNSYASLGEMQVIATFTLSRVTPPGVETASWAMNSTARSVVSVNYLGPAYGSVAVERDAEERALADVAESIRDQVAAALRNRAQSSTSTATSVLVPTTPGSTAPGSPFSTLP